MASGVRRKPSSSGRYQGFFTDEHGKKRYFTGSTGKVETRQIARKLEDDCRQVRLGYREPRQSHFKYRDRLFVETTGEYLEWGKAQGGHKGRPWSIFHANRKKRDLEIWSGLLGLRVLADLDNLLPRVERAIQGLSKDGKAGKTIANSIESLRSFIAWCVKRHYLSADPLADLGKIDTTPRSRYRALTIDETYRLLKAAPEYLRLTYVVAMLTGLRASELRSLTQAHLDTVNMGLRLEAAWTKNREAGFQPLPARLIRQLQAFADSGVVPELYRQFYTNFVFPQNALLYVPSHPARELDKHLEASGIPKRTPEGKIAFHALRTSFVTFSYEAGASDLEAQRLARHSTPALTANVYGRTREPRLAEITQRMADRVLSGEFGAPVVYENSAGVTPQIVKYQSPQGLRATGTDWRRGDSNPRPEMVQDKHLRV